MPSTASSTVSLVRIHRVLIAIAAALILVPASGQDIDFKNRVATFTNLEGRLFNEVHLIRGDLDGILWRDGASGGRVCYTNMNAELLQNWGISGNRVEVAKVRAAAKAASDAKYRAFRVKAAQAEMETRRKEDLEWRAEEPARQREAQRQADLAAIETLRRQLEIAQERVDIANAVTPEAAAGDPEYVNAVMAKRFQVNLAQVDVNRAKKQLQALEADYDRKYGSGSKSAPTTR